MTDSIRYKETDLTHAALLPFVAVCEQGGGRFIGLQCGVPECGLETLVLFRDPSGTSLALPISQLTPAAVFQKILESTDRFEKAKRKAALGKAA